MSLHVLHGLPVRDIPSSTGNQTKNLCSIDRRITTRTKTEGSHEFANQVNDDNDDDDDDDDAHVHQYLFTPCFEFIELTSNLNDISLNAVNNKPKAKAFFFPPNCQLNVLAILFCLHIFPPHAFLLIDWICLQSFLIHPEEFLSSNMAFVTHASEDSMRVE